MRRATLLALLALTLPTAALANSMAFKLQIGPPLTVGDFANLGGDGCLAVLTTVSCSTNNYLNGQNINVGGDVWVLNLLGPAGRIQLNINNLTNAGPTGGVCHLNNTNNGVPCNFKGTVMAFGPSVPAGAFTDSISGTLTRGPNQTTLGGNNAFVLATLDGEFGNHAGDLDVDNVQFCRGAAGPDCGMPGTNGRLRSGFGEATLLVIPEPGTLALLGTGVIGLAGIVRRRCKLGK